MSFTIEKNRVVRARFPGVNVYADPERKNGTALLTSEFAGQLLGVTTGKVDVGGIDEQVQIVRATSADIYGLTFGWVEDDLVMYDDAPGTIVTESKSTPAGSTTTTPSGTDEREVANPQGGTLTVTLEDLYKLVKDSQPPTAPKVPVWAWVGLGVVFVAGLVLILVNRN